MRWFWVLYSQLPCFPQLVASLGAPLYDKPK